MAWKLFWMSATLSVFSACAAPPPPPPPPPPTPLASPQTSTVSQSKAATTGSLLSSPFAISELPKRKKTKALCRRFKRSFQEPVVVVEDTGLERYPPIVGFAMPFGREAKVRDLAGFVAVGLDRLPLLTQNEALARWGKGPEDCSAPVQWSYNWVLAAVPPSGRSYLALDHQKQTPASSTAGLTVEENKKTVVIDTGPARFTIRKTPFSGLDKVEVKRANKWVEVAGTSDEGAGFLYQRENEVGGTRNQDVLSFEVERSGPVVATIAAKGGYRRPSGEREYRYTIRMTFYAGTGVVEIDHTSYYGATESNDIKGVDNRQKADRFFFRLPLKGSPSQVELRAKETIHKSEATDKSKATDLFLRQFKRSPELKNPKYEVRGAKALETGLYASHPYLAVKLPDSAVVTTVGHLDVRDPQGIGYRAKGQDLEIDWQSEAMWVGGARGIWSKAAIDFAAPDTSSQVRGSQLYAHLTRPLIGAPRMKYMNTTAAYAPIPEAAAPAGFQHIDDQLDALHASTAAYLRTIRNTGLQVWPDLSAASCVLDEGCARWTEGYFEGGDNNFWDWSLGDLEQFWRTADPAFAHDFALPLATTLAETISLRPDPDTRDGEHHFAGYAPCYGDTRGYAGDFREGLNQRRDNCEPMFSYNKVYRTAYLLTGDRRYTDLFEQAANTTQRMLQSKRAEGRPEITVSRALTQQLELLLAASEFGRVSKKKHREIRKALTATVDHLLKYSLVDGHSCTTEGSGFDSPQEQGECTSAEQWTLTPLVDLMRRVHFHLDHKGAGRWVRDWAARSLRLTTVLGREGDPDISAVRNVSKEDKQDGWRSVYTCKANKAGIDENTCRKATGGDGNFYYPANLMAYLNALAIAHELDTQDELRYCSWFPETYNRAYKDLGRPDFNANVWGKTSGLVFAFVNRSLAIIEKCRTRL